MIGYFGRDAQGHYVDHEDGCRVYMTEPLWMALVKAGGKGIPDRQVRLPLKITETVTLEKFENGHLIETRIL